MRPLDPRVLGVGRVLNVNGDVGHLEDALPRGHRALHDAVLNLETLAHFEQGKMVNGIAQKELGQGKTYFNKDFSFDKRIQLKRKLQGKDYLQNLLSAKKSIVIHQVKLSDA